MSRLIDDHGPLPALIVACEVGFWVVLAVALACRYLLRRQRLSTGLLLGLPVIDLTLLGAAVTDVATGAEPNAGHGLAGLYLGLTVAFGHVTVRWADGWAAHRLSGAPRPPRPPRRGAAAVAKEWLDWGRLLLAWAIGIAASGVIALVAGTGVPSPSAWSADPMWAQDARPVPVVGLWLIFGPIWTTVACVLDPARTEASHR
jgi:hypothetical protein